MRTLERGDKLPRGQIPAIRTPITRRGEAARALCRRACVPHRHVSTSQPSTKARRRLPTLPSTAMPWVALYAGRAPPAPSSRGLCMDRQATDAASMACLPPSLPPCLSKSASFHTRRADVPPLARQNTGSEQPKCASATARSPPNGRDHNASTTAWGRTAAVRGTCMALQL